MAVRGMEYTLGTIGFGLIIWLSLLGVRKRRINPGAWSLKAWTIGPCLSRVVAGGGGHASHRFPDRLERPHARLCADAAGDRDGDLRRDRPYATLPASLSANRKEMTRAQML